METSDRLENYDGRSINMETRLPSNSIRRGTVHNFLNKLKIEFVHFDSCDIANIIGNFKELERPHGAGLHKLEKLPMPNPP